VLDRPTGPADPLTESSPLSLPSLPCLVRALIMASSPGGATEYRGDACLAAPRRARVRDQLRATLWQQALVKRRTPRATCCALVSPALFISICVVGYHLTDPETFDAAIYAVIALDVGPLLSLAVEFASGPGAGGGGGFGPGGLVWESSGNSTDLDLLSVRRNLEPLLTGPLPVFGLPSYAGVSSAARSALSPSNYEQLTELDKFARLFGNLLTLGTLHLAPSSAAAASSLTDGVSLAQRIDELEAHLQAGGGNVSTRVHADEAAALAHLGGAADAARDAWALLVFDSLAPRQVEYAVRLNYTTVPNTNRISKRLTRGLDTEYTRLN